MTILTTTTQHQELESKKGSPSDKMSRKKRVTKWMHHHIYLVIDPSQQQRLIYSGKCFVHIHFIHCMGCCHLLLYIMERVRVLATCLWGFRNVILSTSYWVLHQISWCLSLSSCPAWQQDIPSSSCSSCFWCGMM